MKTLSLPVYLALTLALATTAAFAKTPEEFAHDMQLVQPWLGANEKLAFSYLIDADTKEQDAINFLQDSYKLVDLNKDGRQDLVLIAEDIAKRVQEDGWVRIEHGKRRLRVYLADKNGDLQPFSGNDQIVLGGDEGGVFGDPLNGLTINAKGAIRLSFYGGSRYRWGHSYVIQFRNNDFYHIGMDQFTLDNVEGTFHSESRNLLTGEVIIKDGTMGSDKEKVTRKREKVKPLVRLKDMKALEF